MGVMYATFELKYRYGWVRRLFGIQQPLYANNTIAAFDAETGKQLWSHTEEPWYHFAAAGDEGEMNKRLQEADQDPLRDVICGPDAWAIPIIAGDGTVYAGSGITPNFYAIRDRDGNGVLSAEEI